MVTTGPRMDVVEDHSTFFWCYAFLADPGCTFSEQLSSYYSKGLGSTDDLSSLFFILWELFPKDICNVWHCPVGSDDQHLMIKSTTAETSTSVGSVALLGCEGSSAKGAY